MSLKIFLYFLLFGLNPGILTVVECKNILVLCPMASKSHKNFVDPIVTSLALRGHEVTLVSSHPRSKYDNLPSQNVREIVAGDSRKFMAQIGRSLVWEGWTKTLMGYLSFTFQPVFDSCHQVYRNAEFMELLNGTDFDLIFMDSTLHDCLLGFIHKLSVKAGGTPFVLLSPSAATTSVTQLTGNRHPLSFVPDFMVEFSDDMTFVERLLNLIASIGSELALYYGLRIHSTAIYRHYLGTDIPDASELIQNAAMVMTNSHYLMNYPRPTMPDVIEISGLHCRPALSLPQELEEFCAGSGHHGFILFSFGSIIDGQTMPAHVQKIFLKVFSRLTQRVVWKWETDIMRLNMSIPQNVKFVSWLPQQDLLGHPNIKLFMTHGGFMSMQEATYHAVPILGFPLFGDGHRTVNKAVKHGYGLGINILSMTENTLERKIREILNDTKYVEGMRKFSKLYRDQQNSPLSRAVYWSEYLMRNNGAVHLRSAARKLNFLQYHCIDIILTILCIIFCIAWLLKAVMSHLWRTWCLTSGSEILVKKCQ